MITRVHSIVELRALYQKDAIRLSTTTKRIRKKWKVVIFEFGEVQLYLTLLRLYTVTIVIDGQCINH
jgi:hypothetical protein